MSSRAERQDTWNLFISVLLNINVLLQNLAWARFCKVISCISANMSTNMLTQNRVGSAKGTSPWLGSARSFRKHVHEQVTQN